jgi:LysR family glycine cleavage system transcriptional activator
VVAIQMAVACICSFRAVPVCAPQLLQRAHPLRDPNDLTNYPLLQVEPRASDWPKWLEAAGLKGVDASSGQQYPTLALALDAASSGLGIAIADRRLVANDVE